MELFIRIVNGQPFEHPIMGENFRQAFPDIDTNNLPTSFAKFERIEKPNKCTPYQVEEVQYAWVEGIVKDVWATREMTAEEKAAAFQSYTDDLVNRIEIFKNIATEQIANATTDGARNVWSSYLATLQALTWTEPTEVQFPWPPMIDANGNAISNESSGSAPNVIG
jgi:hypothetical protein